MPCQSCNVQFGIIMRKKSCLECHRHFCKNCLERRHERVLCQNCMIFTKRPLSKPDLGQLRVKELIFYLQSKHISTSGCVEKEDLINLVIAHVNSGTGSSHSSLGSPGSGASAGAFHFSSASSTGGGGESDSRGRRESRSSSKHGNLYTAGAETIDQIKNTCQNFFSTLSDRFTNDIPKSSSFVPRFSTSSSEDPLRPRTSDNVSEQPRFGANDVHQVQPNSDGHSFSPQADSMGPRPSSNETALNDGSNLSPINDGSMGSGTTGSADSSAHTSSMSSPVHTDAPPPDNEAEPTKYKLSLNARIESMLFATNVNQNGCDCTDDEEDGNNDDAESRLNEMPRRKNFRRYTEGATREDQPGPSQCDSNRIQIPESKTSSSSFDELNGAEYCESQTKRTPSADTENWQIINQVDVTETSPEPCPPAENSSSAASTMQEPMQTTVSIATTTEVILGEKSNEINPTEVPSCSNISRRRSDSYLITQNACIVESAIASGMRQQTPHDVQRHVRAANREEACPTNSSSQSTNKCFKCGKRRTGIRKQLKKFRKQLETSSDSEVDKRRQLEAFLNYLERRSKGSVELTSDSESPLSEDASIAEVPSSSMMEATSSRRGPGGTQLQSSAATASGHPWSTEKANLYSTGNLDLASKAHIKLSDIKESADLDILTVKQLKEILMLNRVDFKGCCEKPELRERVLRLWRDYKSFPSIEKLPTDDLCKICMDAPIECVILECGHMTTCTACGKVLSECPICRQYIVRVVRFFRA